MGAGTDATATSLKPPRPGGWTIYLSFPLKVVTGNAARRWQERPPTLSSGGAGAQDASRGFRVSGRGGIRETPTP